jgi:hypothetical protein
METMTGRNIVGRLSLLGVVTVCAVATPAFASPLDNLRKSLSGNAAPSGPAIRLDDRWTLTFQCPAGVPRTAAVSLTRSGRILRASVSRDACLGAMSWEGNLPKDVITAADLPLAVSVRITTTPPGAYLAARSQGTVTIDSPDHVALRGIGPMAELTRGMAPAQPAAMAAPQNTAPPQPASYSNPTPSPATANTNANAGAAAGPPIPHRPSEATQTLDVLGLRTGMTLEQATAALKREAPGAEISEQKGNVSIFGASAPALFSLTAKLPAPSEAKGSSESVVVSFSGPPTQLVYRVSRHLKKPMIRAEIEGALQKKYGPATEAHPYGMEWRFDEQGNTSATKCAAGPRSTKAYSKLPNCQGATVSAQLIKGADDTLLAEITVMLTNTPLMVWGDSETNTFLADMKDKANREKVEKAKQEATTSSKTKF